MRLPVQNITFILLAIILMGMLTSCLSRRRATSSVLKRENYHRKKGDILTDVSGTSGFYVSSGNLLTDYAGLLGVETSELKNEKLYRFINDWIGTPYAYGGTTKNGIDCSGFAATLISEIYGKNLPRSSEDQANAVKRKYERQLKEGDLVFFSFGGSSINHVGVYLHNGRFVHASTSKGVIISNLKDGWYYKSFKRAGAVK